MNARAAWAASLVVACTTSSPPRTSTSTSASPSTPRVETAAPVAPDLLTSTDACTKDDECLVTNQGTCCAACPRSPHALSVASHTQNERLCATVDCAMRDGVTCDHVAPASDYRAVCRAGTCAGVKHGLKAHLN